MSRDRLLLNIKKHLLGADAKGALPASIDRGMQTQLNKLFNDMLDGAQQYFSESQINTHLATMHTDLKKVTQLARPFLNSSFPGLIIQSQLMAHIHVVLLSNMGWKDLLKSEMNRLSKGASSISMGLIKHFKKSGLQTTSPMLVEAIKFYQLLTTHSDCLNIGRFLISMFRTYLEEGKFDIAADLKSPFQAYMRDCQNASNTLLAKRRPKTLSPIVTDIKSKKDSIDSKASFDQLKAGRLKKRANRLPFWSEVESERADLSRTVAAL